MLLTRIQEVRGLNLVRNIGYPNRKYSLGPVRQIPGQYLDYTANLSIQILSIIHLSSHHLMLQAYSQPTDSVVKEPTKNSCLIISKTASKHVLGIKLMFHFPRQILFGTRLELN
jgi:hypothetical protein